MKMFKLDFGTLMIRYYLMMAAVIVAGFTGNWWVALLALPIFLSCLIGATFSINRKKTVAPKLEPKRASMQTEHGSVQNAA